MKSLSHDFFHQVLLNPFGDKTEIQGAITNQVLGKGNLQCGPRNMFVLITIRVSWAWMQLGIMSVIPAPFVLTIYPQGPEKWRQKDKQLLVLLVETVSGSFESLSCLSQGRSGTVWEGLGGDNVTIKPLQLVLKGSRPQSLFQPASRQQGQHLHLQSLSFRNCWREQDPQLSPAKPFLTSLNLVSLR